jgi:hypothetical protein
MTLSMSLQHMPAGSYIDPVVAERFDLRDPCFRTS